MGGSSGHSGQHDPGSGMSLVFQHDHKPGILVVFGGNMGLDMVLGSILCLDVIKTLGISTGHLDQHCPVCKVALGQQHSSRLGAKFDCNWHHGYQH